MVGCHLDIECMYISSCLFPHITHLGYLGESPWNGNYVITDAVERLLCLRKDHLFFLCHLLQLGMNDKYELKVSISKSLEQSLVS